MRGLCFLSHSLLLLKGTLSSLPVTSHGARSCQKALDPCVGLQGPHLRPPSHRADQRQALRLSLCLYKGRTMLDAKHADLFKTIRIQQLCYLIYSLVRGLLLPSADI